MDNQIKGAIYEKYVCDFLNNEGHSWLWSDVPEKHLDASDLVHDLNKYVKDSLDAYLKKINNKKIKDV